MTTTRPASMTLRQDELIALTYCRLSAPLKWYVAAVNAQDVPLEVKIEDILAGLDCNPDEIAVISGGNIPERENCKADAVLTVNKNDGVVLIIS